MLLSVAVALCAPQCVALRSLIYLGVATLPLCRWAVCASFAYLGSFALACGVGPFRAPALMAFTSQVGGACYVFIYHMSIGNHVRTVGCGLPRFGVVVLRCSCLYISISAIVQDPCRMGVWLGWHICYNVTQVSQGQLRENRNLSSSIRAKAALIYVLSVPVHNVNKYLSDLSDSLCVKARPSDPLVYV